MKKLRDCSPLDVLRTVYYALCQSVIQYCIRIWGSAGKSTFIILERAQRALIKVSKDSTFHLNRIYTHYYVQEGYSPMLFLAQTPTYIFN
ncbi:hypothetical protein B5X24_HaOG214575 [Helicoverpa armigera]|nr:hypothetical protein B5X24_HaOG214575 [Helicoverpa armigera]